MPASGRRGTCASPTAARAFLTARRAKPGSCAPSAALKTGPVASKPRRRGWRSWRPGSPPIIRARMPAGACSWCRCRDELVRSSRTELLLVFGAVFCLLLLVCANVASLAIARGAARAREMAIRLALGAGRDAHRPRASGGERAVRGADRARGARPHDRVVGRRDRVCAGGHPAPARSRGERQRRVVRDRRSRCWPPSSAWCCRACAAVPRRSRPR